MNYGELLTMVPATKNEKLPSIKAMRERSAADILVADEMLGITVFKDGFYLYTQDGHSTVFGVDRCMGIPCGFTEGENNTARNITNTISEDECKAMDWVWPLLTMGSRRLDRNEEERENSRTEYHTDGDGNDWYGETEGKKPGAKRISRELQALAEKESDDAFREWKENKLAELRIAMEQLTDRQKQVVELYYFSEPDMTEKKVAAILSKMDGKQITQQGVHKTLSLAVKKLQKLMGC